MAADVVALASAAWNRVANSWEHCQVTLAERVAAGTQPSTPFATPRDILYGNVAYVVITFALYRFMAGRKEGFNIKPIIAVYNLICVGLAGAVVYGVVTHKLQHPGTYACNVGNGTGPAEQRLAWYFWLFYIQKYWEFLDTWFFLLRRSFRQVTFLHVYHHSSISVVVGLILPHDFAGDVYLPIVLNSFVHVLMYSHYFITSVSSIKPWWSQYLTSLQLIQFVLIAAQCWISFQAGPTCGMPDFAKLLIFFYMGTMLILFGKFYVERYLKPKSGGERKAKAA